MAETLLSDIFNGELDHHIVLDTIKKGVGLQVKDVHVSLSELVPYFLTYLREKLTPILESKRVYHSPRQIEEKRKHSNRKTHNSELQQPDESVLKSQKSARISLQYSSSPFKTRSNIKQNEGDDDEISGISPIKSTRKPSSSKKKTHNHRNVKTNCICLTNETTPSNFELNSLDDFPAMSLSTQPKIQQIKTPRRITVTPIETKPCNTFISSKPDIGATLFDESSFETQNADSSFNHLFTDHTRFIGNTKDKNILESSVFTTDYENSANGFDTGFSFTEMVHQNMKVNTPTKEMEAKWSLNQILNKELLDIFVDLYTTMCLYNLVPNLTLEFYFLFNTLTCVSNSEQQSVKYSFPFANVQCCVYFAGKCLENLLDLILLLDVKTIQLLANNERLKMFTTQEFTNRIQGVIKMELDNQFDHSLIIKSPMTGIPFQVESDNRKSFLSDRHFYCFSKKRDAFYSLIREWEENYLDPDWNIKDFMSNNVPELMKITNGINVHYQLARLFVKQLIEMVRTNTGYKTEDSNTSDSVLLEFKKTNPSKFQNLQERLTRPSVNLDLCPKPNFSLVEDFFREFIIVADSFCFNKYLMHILLNDILQINSRSFGLDFQGDQLLNKSDIGESLWQDIKAAISELRLLAKFLGFVTFLAYTSANDRADEIILPSRNMVIENLNFSSLLQDSLNLHRLLITIPWIVDFLSMADKNAFKFEVYRKPLLYLASLVTNQNTHIKKHRLINFIIVQHIGWLFEQPCVQNISIFDTHVFSYDFQQKDHKLGIDDIIEPDKAFLYGLCPYLKDVKKPLVDFSKGTIGQSSTGSLRKITPIRATSDTFSLDIKYSIKIQLIENFLKYQPNHIQDCIKFITERHLTNIKQHISSTFFIKGSENVLEKIKEEFSNSHEADVDTTIDTLKLQNHSLYSTCLEEGWDWICETGHIHLNSYLKERVKNSISSILPESTHSKVLDISSKVIKHNIRIKIQEWLKSNYVTFVNEVDVLYNRSIMTILKNREKTI